MSFPPCVACLWFAFRTLAAVGCDVGPDKRQGLREWIRRSSVRGWFLFTIILLRSASYSAEFVHSRVAKSPMCFRQNHFEREPATTIAFLTGHFKRIAFWLWSRMATAIYRRLPVFGRLRGSNAIIESRGRFLLLRRNDGLGLCFPGGLASGAESTLDAL